ncbi:MAG: ATP-dependent RNA helicase RhlB [Rhodanobacteraceae bacterium]|nr:ATP-dependent RNA helicase RhlB [Rhodanobacteraceae bacterium]
MSDKPLTDVCFENFSIHPELLKGLESAGFIRCTPIQALTLPLTLAGKDVAGQAQTGTGKTAAFLVSMFNRLLTKPARADRKANEPRAVILAPTRELAIQIDKDARQIGHDLGLRMSLIYGGVDYDKQRSQLADGTDVIIATPGRLIDFFKQHAVSLSSVDVVILDEADRMFDLGFIKDIPFLLRRMPGPHERQNMLFSATLSHRVLELAYEHMNEPEKIVVETETITAARVRQVGYYPATDEKIPLLLHLLHKIGEPRGMVFVNMKIAAERVARKLEAQGWKVGLLSGDVPQKKRESLLNHFQKGELELLVATDVAARGLHINGVTHVFNYDLPHDAEDYVHRIGRTARLGAEGDAVSFACEDYAVSLPDIEKFIEQKIPFESITPDMLTAPPKREREPGEGRSELAEVLDAAAAKRREDRDRKNRDGKSGGGRRSSTGSGSASAPRGERKSSGGERRDGQKPRHDSPRPQQSAVVPVEANAANESPADAERRRNRRRRKPRGERVEASGTAAIQQPITAEIPLVSDQAPFFSRLKQKIKQIVQRLPMPGRRR